MTTLETNGTNADPTASWQDPPGMGKSILIGSTIGVVLAFIFVTGGMLATGTAWQSAVGLGVFVAFWGGVGFGSMLGGVTYVSRIQDEHS
ncbi:MAG: hypothetical protein ABIP03_02505 [Aquihabitans sp.]